MDSLITAVLVGCGNISKIWLDAIQTIPNLKIVGLVDAIEQKAIHAANGIDYDVNIDTEVETSLQNNSPDIVFDCTTPDARFSIISTALRFGCHVLVEKPLAVSIADARKIVSLAEKEKKVCATMQNFRFSNGFRRLRDFVHSGKLGDITFCNTNFFIGSHFNDYRNHSKHILLHDMAIHTFDSVRAVLAADPISVYCKEWNPKGSWYDHDACAVAIFEFSNDIVYTYQGSWCSQGLRTQWTSQWRINGTLGSLIWDGNDKFSVQLLDGTQEDQQVFIDSNVPVLQSDKFEGHAGAIRDFIHCIRTNRQPQTVFSDNIKSLNMVFAGIESAKLAEKVVI